MGRLAVLPSPKPLIEQCPAGSVLVKAKYASVCGSDMPYFKAKSLMAPSSYWVRQCQRLRCTTTRVDCHSNSDALIGEHIVLQKPPLLSFVFDVSTGCVR